MSIRNISLRSCGALLIALSCLSSAWSGATALAVVDTAYSRPLAPGQTTGVVYLSLKNQGQAPIILSAVSSSLAQSAEFHRHIHEGGVMKMRHEPNIPLAIGKTLRFQPGGYHIMLFGVKKPLAVGDQVPLTISTGSGETLDIVAEVRAY